MNRLAAFSIHFAKTLTQAIGIVALVFFLARIVPGDAVDVMALQGDLTEVQAQQMREELGLDRPIIVQFADWAGRALTGDFGQSLRFGRPVSEMLLAALPVTLTFAALSFLTGALIAFTLAITAAMTERRGFAAAVDFVNIWSISLPTFCVGVVGILVFSLWLGWLPVLGSMILPVIIIGIDNGGQIVKPLFEELKEASTSAHVRTARSKGLSPLRIALRHLLPTAVPVALALSGLVLSGLIAGTLTMEVLFGLPGVGSLMLNAIHGRDYPVIQAAISVVAVGLVLVNALADLLHRLVDPRLST